VINKVILVGRLTKDPELKWTEQGVPVANFTLAVSKKYQDGQGNTQEKTAFILCKVWRKKAESPANFKKKGDVLGVTGEIETRSFDGNNGQRQFITEVLCDDIEYLPSGGGQQGNQQGGQNNQGYQNNNQGNYNNNNQRNYNNGNQQNYNSQNNNQGYQNNNRGNYQNNNQGNYNNNQQQPGGYSQPQKDPFAEGRPIDISDDELPF
jgi:single-strand DNA-binding protein